MAGRHRDAPAMPPSVSDASPWLAGYQAEDFQRRRKNMSAEKLQGIVDQIKDLSLLEASQLVKIMEDTFGVSAAAAAVAAAPAAGAAAAPAVEEKDEFDVILTGLADPGKKIGV